MILTRRFRFEAAHRLPGYDGPCRNPHGHSYKLHVSVRGPVGPGSGMVVDFHEVERIVGETVLSGLDHRDLNECLENPTAENLAVWIWDRLKRSLPGLHEIRLEETENCSVTYGGEDRPDR